MTGPGAVSPSLSADIAATVLCSPRGFNLSRTGPSLPIYIRFADRKQENSCGSGPLFEGKLAARSFTLI